jgi:lipopolysaccharide transport system permease protein
MESKSSEAITSQTGTNLTAGSPDSPSVSLQGKPRVLIDADDASVRIDLADLWTYRELLYFLTWRDIKVRYKQTFMGAAWVIVQPLFTMLVFTLIFNKFAGVSSGDIPYPLFAYSGLVVWTFFSTAVVHSTSSLISNTNLITKVYFPRMFIPAASVAAGMLDLIFASVIMFALLFYYGLGLSWSLLLLPLFAGLTGVLALGVGLLTSSLTVKYRDLRHALPFLIQIWMFASPVIYPSSIIPGRWRWILAINPLTSAIEGFRSALTGRAFNWPLIAIHILLAILLLVTSAYIFRRTEDSFADVI